MFEIKHERQEVLVITLVLVVIKAGGSLDSYMSKPQVPRTPVCFRHDCYDCKSISSQISWLIPCLVNQALTCLNEKTGNLKPAQPIIMTILFRDTLKYQVVRHVNTVHEDHQITFLLKLLNVMLNLDNLDSQISFRQPGTRHICFDWSEYKWW